MSKIALTTNIDPPNAVDIWCEDVKGVNADDPIVVEVRVTVRSNAASGRQIYSDHIIEVRNGDLGNPGADPPVPPVVATESVGITRGPASYRQGVVEKRAIIVGAMTRVIDAFHAAGNAGGQSNNQRKEAKKNAVLTQLLADGIIDATLTGAVS